MREAEEVLQHLLNGDARGGGLSLSEVLSNIGPPDLCRISLTLLVANYNEIKSLKHCIYTKDDLGKQRRQKVADGVVQAVIVAVVIAAMKALGWI